MSADCEERTDARVDDPIFALGQEVAEHSRGPAHEAGADDVDDPIDVGVGGLVSEDLDAVLFPGRHEPRSAEDVVAVIVGVDERLDRFVGDLAEFG